VLSYLRTLDRKGLGAGLATMFLLGGGIFLGSHRLRDYDPVLLTYTFGVVFSAFAVVYRYAVWLQRPPTLAFWRRGWRLVFARGQLLANLAFLARATASNIGAQRFIRRRGFGRWIVHFCISWGCMLAVAVTFPLVFGWLHFETRADDPQIYRVVMLGIGVGEVDTRSLARLVMFNLLNISAVMVIAGVALSLNRRLKDMANISRQQFGNDIVPLVLLLGISLTGLMLTFSMHALGGAGYQVLSLVHAVTVTATFLYIPFGKFFHIFQRPAQIGVLLYKRTNASRPPAKCRACGAEYGFAMQIQDLKGVMAAQGFDWSLPGGGNYMEVCPRCRRRSIGIAQGHLIAAARAGAAAQADTAAPEGTAARAAS
jgi:hypothetical protein